MSCKIIGAGESLHVQGFDWGPQPQCAASKGPRRDSILPAVAQSREANSESDEQISLARQQGIQEGRRQSEDETQRRLDARLAEINARYAATVSELAALRPRLRRQAEKQVVELALHVARKILNRALSMDPDALTGLVSAAISRIDARELLEIRVSAIHHNPIKAALDKMCLPGKVQLIADQSLEPGAVIIESTRGRLDASVSTQLVEIERGFADCLSPGGSE